MKVSELVQALIAPFWAAWFFMALATFVSHAWGEPGRPWLPALDLRLEANLGAWFAGLALVLASLSCLESGWVKTAKIRKTRESLFFRLAAFGFLFLSALEISQVHAGLSQWLDKALMAGGGNGFLILGLVSIPIMVTAWLFYIRLYFRLLPGLPRPRLALLMLAIVALGLPLWVFLSGMEKLAWGKHGVATLLACLEETSETALALAFVQANLIFGEGERA